MVSSEMGSAAAPVDCCSECEVCLDFIHGNNMTGCRLVLIHVGPDSLLTADPGSSRSRLL
jgi:hypothetical protein